MAGDGRVGYMLPDTERTFRYLNRDGQWRGFHIHGLALNRDGAVRLSSLPRLVGSLPDDVAALPLPDGPEGLAVGPDGTIYFTDPSAHRILAINPCPRPEEPEGEVPESRGGCPPCVGERPSEEVVWPIGEPAFAPVPCLGGFGRHFTQFDRPRGLLFHPVRRALFVADSGNERIQVFDTTTLQLVDVWGGFVALPKHSAPLRRPWSLAADAAGNVYAVNAGTGQGGGRIQKFDLRATPVPEFWDQVQATLEARGVSLAVPTDVAVVDHGGRTRIWVLDGEAGGLLVFDGRGRCRQVLESKDLRGALGLAVTSDAIYVGHNVRRQVLRLRPDGTSAGAALGYEGPVAALMLHGGLLLVHTGAAIAPIQLEIDGAYARHGFLWAGPFPNYSHLRQEWHRLQASVETLSAGRASDLAPAVSHFQLFLYPSEDPQANPGDPGARTPPWQENAVDLLAHLADLEGGTDSQDVWVRVPRDVPEAVFHAMVPAKRRYGKVADNEGWTPLDHVWVGVEFWSEGAATPSLEQIQLDYDHVTYLQHLPAIYGEDPAARQLLGRWLSLFESMFEDVEIEIGTLPALFDPAAAQPDWLPWLARWLDMELHEDWDVAAKRRAIASAFNLHRLRGTRRGLEAAVRRDTGLDVVIEEPIVQAGWWALPGDEGSPAAERASILGVTTMLVAAEAQGAVVGTTATLDRSHLIAEGQMGAPLFQDLAHRFTVRVYRGAHFTPHTLMAVAEVLEREKPAHTSHHVCLVEPCMRIGFQARLGIDTIVAGPAMPTRLGTSAVPASQVVLGGQPPGRLGRDSRLGETTRLGASPEPAPSDHRLGSL
ncbi:MAG: phage tail protein [Anaerolineae bacterium]|nr:phage tail protein [Anaerolineae bacterium]